MIGDHAKYLVIGASGQVGEHLMKAAARSRIEAIGTSYRQHLAGLQLLDIFDAAKVIENIAFWNPSVIFLPASLTNVDYCEKHVEEGYQVNVVGVQNVVRAARQVGAKLVYFSSDYIFDGQNGPYGEEALANPICEYGRQKLIAEHHVALHAQDYLIIRTTVVYGVERQGKNFVIRLLKSLKDQQAVRVPDDQVGSPTYAPDLASACVDLVQHQAQGVYNIVGRERVSRYQFALEAASVFGLDGNLIQAVATAQLGQVASRPLDAGLVVEKAELTLERKLLGYREGLQQMMQDGEIEW